MTVPLDKETSFEGLVSSDFGVEVTAPLDKETSFEGLDSSDFGAKVAANSTDLFLNSCFFTEVHFTIIYRILTFTKVHISRMGVVKREG